MIYRNRTGGPGRLIHGPDPRRPRVTPAPAPSTRKNPMLRPRPARHRLSTAVVLGRLALGALSLSSLLSVAVAYFTH